MWLYCVSSYVNYLTAGLFDGQQIMTTWWGESGGFHSPQGPNMTPLVGNMQIKICVEKWGRRVWYSTKISILPLSLLHIYIADTQPGRQALAISERVRVLVSIFDRTGILLPLNYRIIPSSTWTLGSSNCAELWLPVTMLWMKNTGWSKEIQKVILSANQW